MSKIEWTEKTVNEQLTLAYLAGMIDADGYISIQRSIRKGVAYYGPTVGIAGTRREPHDLAASIWGGVVSPYAPKNPKHRTQFQWSRMGRVAIDVIVAIEPYLRVKKRQAELACEIFTHLEMGRTDDPYPWYGPEYDGKEECERMFLEMVSLNQSRNRLRGNLHLLDGRTYDEFPKTKEVL